MLRSASELDAGGSCADAPGAAMWDRHVRQTNSQNGVARGIPLGDDIVTICSL